MPYNSSTKRPGHATDYPIIPTCMHRGMELLGQVVLEMDQVEDGVLQQLLLQPTNNDRVYTKSVIRTSKSIPS